MHIKDDEAFRDACEYVHLRMLKILLSAGVDRLPPKEIFDKHYKHKFGRRTWEEVLWFNNPLSARLTSWRHSYEAHRDARLVYAQAWIGRPMELRRRLYLGKFAGGLTRRGADGYTPREAAILRGNIDCVAVIDEVAEEYTGVIMD